MTSDPETLLLSDGAVQVRVARQGAALTDARFDGEAFLVPGGGPEGRFASFPLVPFGNRLENNSFALEGTDYRFLPNSADPLYLHGDGWLEPWDIDKVDRTSVTLSLRHRPNAISPYDYSAWQTVSLGDNSLTLHLSVRHEGNEPLLYGLGQHPFFARTAQMRLAAPARIAWSERDGHLPGESGPLTADLDFAVPSLLPDRFVNNAFTGWDGRASITWPERRLVAEIDAAPMHDIYMLYMPLDRTDFFCFEPMTHLPNAHHMSGYAGLKRLAAGESIRSEITIRLRRT
ncbi:MAG TPA: aldose 1-epimerase [Rhizobium sp.]|nr:aldose 1-epimerase [Rhizobium sp.]